MDIIRLKRKKLLAIVIPCVVGWGFAYLALDVYKDYSFGLFVWLPMVMGMLSTFIHGSNVKLKRRELWKTSVITLSIFCVGLLSFAWEGVICILMALPIGLLFNYAGHMLAYFFLDNGKHKNIPSICIILFLSVPGLMSFENVISYKEDLRSVTTSIDINAPIETVWKNIIEFPHISEPNEFIFKTGIAYPTDAVIDGHGVGAIRHCNFSTGSFVEPITVWNEPNLLRFTVTDQPEPMKEMSPYDIHPNHLHGYWVSKQGQFKLTTLSNGHTLVEGTTWYVNKIRPNFYWTLWSDYIVHKIHQRVLAQIKLNSENIQ
jgi:hypothetical protein